MIVEFRVANFRSFRDEQGLSFVASPDDSHASTHCIPTGNATVPKLTRSAVLYGANASGKSNLMFALATMRLFVLQSTKLTEAQFSEQFTPFLLEAGWSSKPTEFEITLLLGEKRYQYGFAFGRERIEREWLYVYERRKPQRWFYRQWNSSTGSEDWEPFSSYFRGPKETWKSATSGRALFLTAAAQLNSEQLKPLLDWFTSGMIIVPARGEPDLTPTLKRLNDPEFKSDVLKMLGAADIHIADIRVDEVKGQQGIRLNFKGRSVSPEVVAGEFTTLEPRFVHRRTDGELIEFDPRYESLGTQRYLAFGGPLLFALATGAFLVIDEFDTSLHPLLVRHVFGMLHDPTSSGRGAQLWITTHDTTLLDTELLRRDQIWFVEKKSDQASTLYPLTDFSPRKHEALERAYLVGRYGAVPVLTK